MSSKVKTYYLVVLVFCGVLFADAQNFTEQGLMSGSGMIFTPTTAVAPSAQFRVQVSRLDYLRKNLYGFNVIELNGGLSSNVEAYVKMYSEQTGTLISPSSLCIGGKLQMPFQIPVFSSTAVWLEAVSSPQSDSLTTLPQNIFRSGVIANLKLWTFQSNLFAGVNKINDKVNPSAGIGILLSVNSSIRVGSEFFYNYFTRKDIQGLFTGSVRIFSNISVQISAGYTSSKEISSWMMTGGLSIATADLDFNPKIAPQPKTTVPSIEEIEKLSMQDKEIGQTIKDPLNDGSVIKETKKIDNAEEQKDDKEERKK